LDPGCRADSNDRSHGVCISQNHRLGFAVVLGDVVVDVVVVAEVVVVVGVDEVGFVLRLSQPNHAGKIKCRVSLNSGRRGLPKSAVRSNSIFFAQNRKSGTVGFGSAS
jgi:hypothetical protein